MDVCPTDADLVKFLDQTLPPKRLAELADHVDSCSHCQSRLNGFTGTATRVLSRPLDMTAPPPGTDVSFQVQAASGSNNGTEPPAIGTVIMGARPSSQETFGSLPIIPGFAVLAELGRGGMGVVFKARNQRLNRLVALKMILAGPAADPQTVRRFLFEARVLARVQHPQVVQVFEVSTYPGANGTAIPYLAMELLEGGSLAKRLKDGPLPPRAAAEMIEGIARAVHATHLQGIVHRDLKPGNILFGRDEPRTESGQTLLLNTSSLPKVCDFGLAKFSDSDADLTGSGQVVGTPHYMAPEQASGSRSFGPGVDIYALGVILFECLTGRRPFEGDEPMAVLLQVVHEPAPDVRSFRPEVPRDLAAVVAKCLEKDPRRRYASAEGFADDLKRFLDNRPTLARPLRPTERLSLWAKRNPALTCAIAAAALALIVGTTASAIFGLWAMSEAERANQKAEDERAARIAAMQSELRTQEARELAEAARRNAESAERDAKQAEKFAAAAYLEAERQRMIANRRQADLEFSRAVTSCEEGRIDEGLEAFLRVVELAEANAAADETPDTARAKEFDRELARVARLNLAAWYREQPPKPRAFVHDLQPRAVAFLPNGKHMIAVARDAKAFLWDLTTGKRVRDYKVSPRHESLRGIRAVFWSVAVGPDGNTFAVGTSSGHIAVWSVQESETRMVFDAIPDEPRTEDDKNLFSIAFAPDGTLWATDGLNSLQQWDVTSDRAKQKHLGRLQLPTKSSSIINVLILSPDGKFAFTGDRSGNVREWDLTNRSQSRSWSTPGWVQDLSISPDGTTLAATGPAAKVRFINLTDRRPPAPDIDLSGSYGNGVSFAPNHPLLITTDSDGNVRYWHSETGQPVGTPLRLSGEVLRARFRSEGDQFAVIAGTSVYLCDIPRPAALLSLGRDRRIRGLDFSPKGDILASADDFTVELFDTLTHKRIDVANRAPQIVRCLHFGRSPTGGLLRGFRNSFDRMTIPYRDREEMPAQQMGNLRRIQATPDGSKLFLLGETLIARFDPRTLAPLFPAKPSKDLMVGRHLEAMAVRPDGRELLVTFGSNVLFLDTDTLQSTRRGWEANDEILDAVYTADSRFVLIGRRDNTAELLQAEDGKSVFRSAMPHARAVTAVAADPNKKFLATGSRDKTARFWDSRIGLPVGPPLRHRAEITHLIFEPTGNRIATGTGEGHVTLWEVPPPGAEGNLEELKVRFCRPKR
jgi:serine/threonine protein kinase/WD40 repeat protein